ncbi:MAG: AfsR/SARP family transcriptional regulator [Gemmatimonadaceae bacterium]
MAPSLYVLGGTALGGVSPDASDRLLGQSKAVALLVYFALAQAGRRQRRDRLVGLLWPALDQGHARAALRKTIHMVRAVLGDEAIVSYGDEEVQIAPGALWCDAAEFTTAAESGQLGRALDLYKGDLMPGFHLPECGDFQLWLESERAVALERVVAAAWALARDSEGKGQLTDAAGWARVAARHAWTDERVLRRALLMLDRLGDRAGAMSLYDTFARRLRSELDAAPSAETAALVAKLRST